MRADPGKAQGKDTTKDETLTKLIEVSKMQASTATEIFEELATVDGPVASQGETGDFPEAFVKVMVKKYEPRIF